jgi:nucleoside phosphorylase
VATDVTGARTTVLFALDREAAPFRRAARGRRDISVHVSGVGRENARRAAVQLLAGLGQEVLPRLVIAAGFCGALVPSFRVGDIVHSPRIVTVDHIVSDPAEKRRLGASHDAVDMESAAVEEVCAAAGIPFLAVRAVSDAVDTAISSALVRLLSEASGGSVPLWRVGLTVLQRPLILGELLRLARDTKLAARNLANEIMAIISSHHVVSERVEARSLNSPQPR